MITFHRNLNAKNGNMWSYVQSGKSTQAKTLHAVDVLIKQPSGKKFDACLNGSKRAVFAWFKAQSVDVNLPVEIPSNAVRVRFNPKNGDKFFHVNGERVESLREVFLNAAGECWGVL